MLLVFDECIVIHITLIFDPIPYLPTKITMPPISDENILYALHSHHPPPCPQASSNETFLFFFYENIWNNIHINIACNRPILMWWGLKWYKWTTFCTILLYEPMMTWGTYYGTLSPKTNKRLMVGTIIGETKREGQRKAKRCTSRKNQKKGES